MKGHSGAVLTSGLAALAFALVLLQALVVFSHAQPPGAQVSVEVPSPPSGHRWSAPGNRSAVPSWNDPARPRTAPGSQQKPEQRRAPPRSRGAMPEPGPRPARRLTA